MMALSLGAVSPVWPEMNFEKNNSIIDTEIILQLYIFIQSARR